MNIFIKTRVSFECTDYTLVSLEDVFESFRYIQVLVSFRDKMKERFSYNCTSTIQWELDTQYNCI